MNKKIEDEIKELISNEIKGDYTMTNLHSVDLKKFLVEPFCETFEKSFKEGEFDNLFVVLREFPKTCEGYLIVYNLREKLFGLGLQGKKGNHPIVLGFYDTFLEALQGM